MPLRRDPTQNPWCPAIRSFGKSQTRGPRYACFARRLAILFPRSCAIESSGPFTEGPNLLAWACRNARFRNRADPPATCIIRRNSWADRTAESVSFVFFFQSASDRKLQRNKKTRHRAKRSPRRGHPRRASICSRFPRMVKVRTNS